MGCSIDRVWKLSESGGSLQAIIGSETQVAFGQILMEIIDDRI